MSAYTAEHIRAIRAELLAADWSKAPQHAVQLTHGIQAMLTDYADRLEQDEQDEQMPIRVLYRLAHRVEDKKQVFIVQHATAGIIAAAFECRTAEIFSDLVSRITAEIHHTPLRAPA